MKLRTAACSVKREREEELEMIKLIHYFIIAKHTIAKANQAQREKFQTDFVPVPVHAGFLSEIKGNKRRISRLFACYRRLYFRSRVRVVVFYTLFHLLTLKVFLYKPWRLKGFFNLSS